MILKVQDFSHEPDIVPPGWFVVGDVLTVECVPPNTYDCSDLPNIVIQRGAHNYKECYGVDSMYIDPHRQITPETTSIKEVTCGLLEVKTKTSSYLIAFDGLAYLCNDDGKTVEKFTGTPPRH
jgi:hypothetical protein